MRGLITVFIIILSMSSVFAKYTPVNLRIQVKEEFEEFFVDRLLQDVRREIFLSEVTEDVAELRILTDFAKKVQDEELLNDEETKRFVERWTARQFTFFKSVELIAAKSGVVVTSDEFKEKVTENLDMYEFFSLNFTVKIYTIFELVLEFENETNTNELKKVTSDYVKVLRHDLTNWNFKHQK